MNYLTIEEQALHTTSQRFAEAQFADLDDHPCSQAEDTFLTVGTFLLAISPVLVLVAFMVA
jgi:hypothetical protein